MNKKKGILNSNALYTFIAISVGFLVGAILLMLAGISPAEAYGKLITGVFGKPKFVTWSIVYAAPLILTGLSVAFSFRTGVFNIGAEGQFVVGSLAACVVGILVKAPAPIHILLCIVAAMAAGALWGAIVGLLKVMRGVNEVLSYIMFNWIAFYLSNYVVNLAIIHREGGGEATKDVADTARIMAPKAIVELTSCTAANWGIVMAIAAAVVIWFIISKTTLGYQLRSVGFSRTAAEYAGINTNRMFLTAMAISGAMAGLGGAVQTLGMSGRISQFSSQEQFGFQGITVALIGSSNPIGCIFAGLFYGAMKYGGTKLSLVNAPSEVVDIIMGTIIIFIAVSHVFKMLVLEKAGKKKGGAQA
ncbi:MAG: ABC transporter permease [Eubacteriales bacterium]|nr:ABC transporter permease [Eubacteriales bacterium]